MPIQATTPTPTQTSSRPESGSVASHLRHLDENPSKPIALKQKSDKSVGGEVTEAYRAPSGRLYLTQKERVVALDKTRETVLIIPVASEPLAAGEISGKVYIPCKDRVLRMFDAATGEFQGQKECARPQYPNYSVPYFSMPVQDRDGNIWTVQNEVSQNEEGGTYVEGTILIFPPDVKSSSRYSISGGTLVPPVFDSKGNAYFSCTWNPFKITKSGELKKIEMSIHHIFIFNDEPYAIGGKQYSSTFNILYKLDFEGRTEKINPNTGEESYAEGAKQAIINWNSQQRSLAPLVDRNKTIHLLLGSPNSNAKKEALYLKIKPDEQMGRRIKEKRVLPFGLSLSYYDSDLRTRPFMTPGGTVYFFGQRYREKEKDLFPIWAIDKFGCFHTSTLSSEPLGLFHGEGEEVIVPLKNGTVSSFEAWRQEELFQKQKSEDLKKQVVRRAGHGGVPL